MISYAKTGLTAKEHNLLQELLYVGAVRGEDSTGLMSIKKTGTTNWCKNVGLPDNLLDTKESSVFFSGAMWDVVGMFGHNRSATRGAVTVNNAHPFEEGHITLIHNGTLTNAHVFEEMKKLQVDSHLITKLLQTKGVEETLKSIAGAFTLVWFDSDEKKIKLIRNDERPLHMAYSIAQEKFYFASESTMLQWILTRNGVKFDKIVSITSGDLYEFSLNECDYTQTKTELYKPPVIKYQSNSVVPYSPKQVLLSSNIVDKYSKPPIARGSRISVIIDDYVEYNDLVVFTGHGKWDKSIRVSFTGTSDNIEWLDDTDTISVTLEKVRKGKHNNVKVWQYTGIDARPVYASVALDMQGTPRRCPICKFLIKHNQVVSRIRNGVQECICQDCASNEEFDLGEDKDVIRNLRGY
jgi:hypothetical protein